MTTVRIAYVTETWLPCTDGIVTRLVATARQLRRAGHEVLIVAPAGTSPGDTALAGTTVRTVPTVGLRFLYNGKGWGLPLPRVARYLREFDPDVVHVLNPMLLGIAGIAAARRQGRTLVASYHTDVARYAAHYRLGGLVPVIWALLRALHRRAQLNLATSTAARTDLAGHGIGDVRLWPRGVDVDLFRPRSPVVTRPSGTRPIALYVGRLAPEKSLHRLAPLANPASGVRLMLVGDGPARAELERSLHPSTIFTGTLHGADLAQAYRQADLFVFPSTTDTLGLVLLEALASGLPVLAADSPASRETLADCPAARLFPADKPDQLLGLAYELLAAPADVLAACARQYAVHASWTAATETLLALYQQARAIPATPAATTVDSSVPDAVPPLSGTTVAPADRLGTTEDRSDAPPAASAAPAASD